MWLRRRASRHLPGDVSRLLREALGVLHGSVALVTVTLPGEIAVCGCCGERVPDRFRLSTPVDMSDGNRELGRRLRRLDARIRVEMWRRRLRVPRTVAWVKQLQGRGALHQHRVMLCRTPDERERIRVYVALWRRLHVRYGLGYIDDPFHPRKGGRDAVFERAGVAGSYLGNYLGGGQLERALTHDERAGWGHLWWVSPALLRQSGWSLARCAWVRQGWRMRRGEWGSRTWYGAVSYPSWWYSDDHRSWVLAVMGWDGSLPAAG